MNPIDLNINNKPVNAQNFSTAQNSFVYPNYKTNVINRGDNVFNKIKKNIELSKTIVIYPHKAPDSDAISSSILLKKAIKQLYPDKIVDIIINDKVPNYLKELHKLDKYNLTDSSGAVQKYDMAFALDMSAPDILPDPVRYNNARFKVNIDHHKSNSHITGGKQFADVSIVNPNYSSTSQVLYEKFLKNFSNLKLTKDMARNVMLGVITDTAELNPKKVNNQTYRTIKELVTKANINFNKVYSDVKHSSNIKASDLPMYFDIINNIKYKDDFAYSIVDDKYLKQNDSHKKVINRAVDDILKRQGVDRSAIFYNTNLGVKVVFRSKDSDVSVLAKKLGGGGHKNASGAVLNIPIEKALDKVLSQVQAPSTSSASST